MAFGVIGGTGVYDLEGLENVEQRVVETPFGAPSDAYIGGLFAGRQVWFLPRHGKGHRMLPSEINHRANIYGMKLLGVESVLSISAVGSLREDLHPRDIFLPDQYFDRTKKSLEHTFFGSGCVAHISFGDPSCAGLRDKVAAAATRTLEQGQDAGKQVCVGGTYVNMEGPAFSTKAESNFHRQLGFDVIGMTSLPEAKLCREAELCYQAMAMVTDYDCWHEEDGPVSGATVMAHLQANATLAHRVLAALLETYREAPDCPCHSALKGAVFSSPDQVPAETKTKLAALLDWPAMT